MFTLIIITLVAIFAVGYLRSLTPEERTIVIKRTMNAITFSTVYLFRTAKATAQVSYYAGEYAGAKMALEGQDTLDALDSHNNMVADNGGATKMAIKANQDHATNLGMAGMVQDMKAKAIATKAEADAKRDERRVRAEARKAAKA